MACARVGGDRHRPAARSAGWHQAALGQHAAADVAGPTTAVGGRVGRVGGDSEGDGQVERLVPLPAVALPPRLLPLRVVALRPRLTQNSGRGGTSASSTAVPSPIVCWFVDLRRRGSPRRSVVDYRQATTMASPPDILKSDAIASGTPADTSAVTPAVAATGGSAAGSGIPFTPPRPLGDLVGETVRRVLPGAGAFLP